MYLKERENISYHTFLRTLRKKNKLSQERVCAGICTVSAMNRFERGNRRMEKLMRDRFAARLGISCEMYEDYLLPKEYARWEKRQGIIKAIENRKLEQAKAALAQYAFEENLNCIHFQFMDTMRYMILRLEDAPRDMRKEMLQTALKHSVPDVEKALEGAHLLSEQEINLIAELIGLEEPEDESVDRRAWRIAAYEKLISYIKRSCWESAQKEKLYPKIERLISACMQGKEAWLDFSSLYFENECYDMAQVIESRRLLFGFSRKKLTEGICSERSVVRLEREEINLSIEIVQKLFEKLGLCPECRRARVLTNDMEVLFLWEEVDRNQKAADFASWEENLRKLKKALCMEILQNRQEVERLKAMLLYRKGEIGKNEFRRRLEKALEYTLPIKALYAEEDLHLTRSERTIIELLKSEKNGKK